MADKNIKKEKLKKKKADSKTAAPVASVYVPTAQPELIKKKKKGE